MPQIMINSAGTSQAQRNYILNARNEAAAQAARMGAYHGMPVELSGININTLADLKMRGNAAPLPKDVWGEWDRESVQIQRNILAVYNSMIDVARPMNLGKFLHYFKRVSDSGVTANISMDGRSEARADQQEYDYIATPLPIIDETYSYGWRQVLAAQTEGETLDSDGNANAVRKVAEALETIVLDGSSKIVVGGTQLYGLRTHPSRNTRSTGVTLNGTTGANWLSEFKAIIQKLHDDNFFAPATIYLNYNDYFYATTTDYSTAYASKSILARMLEIEGVKEIIPASTVTANEVIAVVKDRSVVQLLNGMPIMTSQLARHNPQDDYVYKVMASAALEIKYDANGNCGVVHSS